MIKTSEYVEALRPLIEARQTRFRRTQSIEVVDHKKFGGPEKTALGRPGSLIVFVARDKERLDEAKGALKAGQAETQRMVDRIGKQMNALKPGPIDAVTQEVAKTSAFGALTYAGATIADPIFLPASLDLTAFVVPYSGGRLIGKGFTFVEYVEEPESSGLELFVLKTDPALSPAEKAALDLVPREMSNLLVGAAYECEYTTLMAAAFAVGGALVGGAKGAVAGAVVGAVIDVALVHFVASVRTTAPNTNLTSDALRRTGPELTAKQLLDLRLQALQAAARAARA